MYHDTREYKEGDVKHKKGGMKDEKEEKGNDMWSRQSIRDGEMECWIRAVRGGGLYSQPYQ